MNSGTRPIDPVEARALRNALRGPQAPRDRALLALGLYTGLRVSSLLGLKLRDAFSQDGRTTLARLRVPRRLIKGRREGALIPLHPAARFALLRMRASSKTPFHPEAPLFASRKGGRPLSSRRAQALVLAAADRAGLDPGVSTHSWRKFFASRIYELTGRDLAAVSRALGHRQIATTARYISFKIDERAEAAILAI